MKGFFDTSVLVALSTAITSTTRPASICSCDSTKRPDAAHSLAEVYSTLTRMPGKHRISGEQAMLFIGSIRERLAIISLTGNEYGYALQASSARGIVGGGIYDAMLCTLRHQSPGRIYL
jgi:hypothetical protein